MMASARRTTRPKASKATRPLDAAVRKRLASHLRSLAPAAPVAVDRHALARHLRALAPDSPVAPNDKRKKGGSKNG